MTPEIKKLIVHLHYGKFYHLEKICEALYKKYEILISEEQVDDFIQKVEAFLREKT